MNAALAMAITRNKVVSIQYVLTDDGGKEIDRSEDGKPLLYLQGAGNIVPGLERALEGKDTGQKLRVDVAPKDGYGERIKKTLPVPRSQLPKELTVEKGARLTVTAPNGQRLPATIMKIMGPTIHLDLNHPLAGKTLHFDVEVVDVRDATEEELAHGHPHGPDGHGGH